MKAGRPLKALLVDIGDVLLSDGWGHFARMRAAEKFRLDLADLNDRHHLTFETYEEGRLTLEQYLDLVVFHRERPFTRSQFQDFMCEQSTPFPDMIALVTNLKARHGLKVAVVSNEGRELNAYRIRKFKLDAFVDAFVSSCFVHMRKPDAGMFRLALDIVQTPARQTVFIDNTPMFVEVAEGLGIRSILHTDFESTRARLASLGLSQEGPD